MKTGIALGVLVLLIGVAVAGFFAGRENGRRDAFTRGVMQGYIESMDSDLEVASDGNGGVKISKEKVELYKQGMRKNADHMRLVDYLTYYDASLFASYPLTPTP